MTEKNALILSAFADEAGTTMKEQLDALHDNGITHIELRGVDGKSVSELTIDEAKQLRTLLDDNGISISAIGSPLGKAALDADFDAYLNTTCRHTLDIASILGATRMRVFSFYVPQTIENETELYDRVFHHIARMLSVSVFYGITLCHENEKGIYGDIPSHCEKLHHDFPILKSVFDPANFAQCHVDTLDAFHQMKPYISYIHIKDVDENGNIVPPGKGICHIKEILSEYREMGGGIVTLEPHLMEFCGLAGLENGEKSQVTNRYASNREAFDDAVRCLKAML